MKAQVLVGIALLATSAIAAVGEADARSEAAKDRFKASHPCPGNGNTHGACPGYVIDHITPLACRGADDPSNMQWQTEAEGKAKDKWERRSCNSRNHGALNQASAKSRLNAGEDESEEIRAGIDGLNIRELGSPGESSNGGSGMATSSGSYSRSHTIYTGPRGGSYYYTASGSKQYVGRARH